MTNEQAIIELRGLISDDRTGRENEALLIAIEKLREKRPHGKWIISEIKCPYCLEYFDMDCFSKDELNKCPNCGADMREDSEA